MKGLLAKKLGMTQLFNPDGTVTAVTVLEAGPCKVLGLRTAEKDGYSAVRIAFGPAKEGKLNSPQLGEFKKANLDGHRHIVEIRNYEGLEAGQELRAEMFAAGELVDVTATSKGKGFQGLIKRHKFSRARSVRPTPRVYSRECACPARWATSGRPHARTGSCASTPTGTCSWSWAACRERRTRWCSSASRPRS